MVGGDDDVDVFVADHSEDDVQLSALEGSQLLAEVFPRGNVMADVADNRWRSADRLPASHQTGEFTDVCESLFDDFLLPLDDAQSDQHVGSA